MKETYKRRRAELMQKIERRSVIIVPTASEHERVRGMPFPFRPDSNFFYLSGFTESNAVLVLTNNKSILFCQEKNPETKLWTGEVAGTRDAVNIFGFNEAYPLEKLDEKMLELLKDAEYVYYPIAQDESLAWDVRILKWVRKSRTRDVSSRPETRDVSPLIAEMRLIKDTGEISLMRVVAKISAQGHEKLMRECHNAQSELELETMFHKHCRNLGCDPLHAYPPIVASGKNACVLHYTKNNEHLVSGNLLLVDAGGERNYYAADITRTFPVNGKFSPTQRALYEIVLSAQKAAIEQVRPGNTVNDTHIAAVRIITEGLVRLGLLYGDVDYLIENELYKKFFPHRTSHWIGLDVHDVGDYKVDGEWRELQAGMVLTVEPGIYVQPDDESVDEKWRGIGIRIEDDILVTEEGYDILSKSAKEIHEIEKLMR